MRCTKGLHPNALHQPKLGHEYAPCTPHLLAWTKFRLRSGFWIV